MSDDDDGVVGCCWRFVIVVWLLLVIMFSGSKRVGIYGTEIIWRGCDGGWLVGESVLGVKLMFVGEFLYRDCRFNCSNAILWFV